MRFYGFLPNNFFLDHTGNPINRRVSKKHILLEMCSFLVLIGPKCRLQVSTAIHTIYGSSTRKLGEGAGDTLP